MNLPSAKRNVYTPLPPLQFDAFSDWLYEAGYRFSERQRILQSIAATRSLEQSTILGYLDRADYPVSELIFEESQPEVPYDDPAWDDADHWELGPAIPPDAVIVPPELEHTLPNEDEGRPGEPIDWKNWLRYVKPIGGGSPEADRDPELWQSLTQNWPGRE